MGRFMVINTHRPDECEAIFAAGEEAMKEGLHPALKEVVSACSCPYGEHGSWTVVDAESAEQALGYLWQFERDHSRAIQVDEMTL